MSNEKYIYSYLFYSMFPGTGTLVFVDDQRLDSRTHVLSISLVFTIISTARIANLKARLRKFHAMFKYI